MMNKTNLIKVLCNFYTNKTYLCLKIGLLILAGYIPCKSVSQIIFYQDVIKGGVTGAGFSTNYSNGSGIINVFIEPGSSIKKAFLICMSKRHPLGDYYKVNNDSIYIDSTYSVVTYNHNVSFLNPSRTIIKDITNFITPTVYQYYLSLPEIDLTKPINTGYRTAYLVIIYENHSLPTSTVNIALNTSSQSGYDEFTFLDLMPINLNNPVGFSFVANSIGTGIWGNSSSSIWLNSIYAGGLHGNDNNVNYAGSGVRGDFYYQQNFLFGLGNDSEDNIFGNGEGDGLADIKQYLNNTTSFDLRIVHDNFPNMGSGNYQDYLAFILAYTSPCDTFSVTHTPDTTICYGVPLQLQVQGGQAWEWTPQVGLSCYDCPNPIFTSDSSILYSVRVWNNDSCSKVFPLRIRVKEPLPDFNFTITPSECGDSTGSVIITPILNGFSYINQTSQDTNTTGVFNTLSSGNYSFSVLNADNCPFDTLIFVPETLSVHADFIASPNAGISPLPVAFTNTSSHANSYQWIYENQTSTQENISHIFHQDGIYPVMLIAYGNSILCADTAYDTIYVYLPIEVEIPNIFTPNSDQNNDQWGIKINVPAEADVQIFNRWGEIIVNRKEEVLSPGFIPLWDGGKHSGGVYYYVIRVRTDFEEKEFKGNITLVR